MPLQEYNSGQVFCRCSQSYFAGVHIIIKTQLELKMRGNIPSRNNFHFKLSPSSAKGNYMAGRNLHPFPNIKEMRQPAFCVLSVSRKTS